LNGPKGPFVCIWLDCADLIASFGPRSDRGFDRPFSPSVIGGSQVWRARISLKTGSFALIQGKSRDWPALAPQLLVFERHWGLP